MKILVSYFYLNAHFPLEILSYVKIKLFGV